MTLRALVLTLVAARRRPESRSRAGRPRGPAHLGRAHLAGPHVVRPRGDSGHHHALHGSLRAARRPGEAHARATPRRRAWPSRGRSRKDGLVYEFVLRKGVLFHNGDPLTADDVKFSCERYRGAASKPLKDRVAAVETPGSSARAHPAQAALARLPDVLHERHRRGLDRAAQVRGEGGRRGLQEGAGGRRSLQVRLLHARRRAGAGGLRAVLAEEPEREAPGAPGDPRRGHAAGRAQARRGGHRLLDPRRAGRGAAADAGPHAQARGHPGPVLALLRRPVGSRSRRGTTAACGRPRASPSTGGRSTRR